MLLFSTSTNLHLEKDLLQTKYFKKGKAELSHFSNGELIVRIKENVRGKGVCVLGSVVPPTDNLLYLLQMINALKKAEAAFVVAIIPHFGYARQNKIMEDGEPLTATLITQFLKIAGADNVVTVTMHGLHTEDNPDNFIRNISVAAYLAKEFTGVPNPVVVSPDKGAEKICRVFSDALQNAPVMVLNKKRARASVVKHMFVKIHQDVKNRNVIIVDDMIDTAGTMMKAVQLIRSLGAKNIYITAVHPVLSGEGPARLRRMNIKKFVFSNTLELNKNQRMKNCKTISVVDAIVTTMQNLVQ
jgi:ribose-phosphate pyrophosphokinase